MKFLVLVLAGLLTASCTINVVDKRISVEELNKAISALAKNQDTMVQAINEIRKDYPKKSK